MDLKTLGRELDKLDPSDAIHVAEAAIAIAKDLLYRRQETSKGVKVHAILNYGQIGQQVTKIVGSELTTRS